MTPISADRAKSLAKLLRHDLAAAGFDIPHALALELVAHQHGAKSWNVLAASGAAAERATRPEMSPGVPVLRVMSAEVALRFYVDCLGFSLDWELRFEPGSPLYVQVSRAKAILHLSEHHGDGSPNGVVWLPIADVYGLQAELHAKPAALLRPGVEADSPGGPSLQVIDPYGNVLRFAQPD